MDHNFDICFTYSGWKTGDDPTVTNRQEACGIIRHDAAVSAVDSALDFLMSRQDLFEDLTAGEYTFYWTGEYEFPDGSIWRRVRTTLDENAVRVCLDSILPRNVATVLSMAESRVEPRDDSGGESSGESGGDISFFDLLESDIEPDTDQPIHSSTPSMGEGDMDKRDIDIISAFLGDIKQVLENTLVEISLLRSEVRELKDSDDEDSEHIVMLT